jgi:hypothetical protein
MAGQVVKEYLVALGFEVDKKGLEAFQKNLKIAAKDIAIGTAAISAAAYAAFKFIDVQAQSLDQLNSLSTKLDTPAEAIERIAYGAGLMGSSADAAKASMEGLTTVVGEAALGIGRGAQTFQKLGLNAKKSNGQVKNTAEIMDDVRKKLKGMAHAEQLVTLQKLGMDPTMLEYMTSNVSELDNEFTNLYRGVGTNINDAGKKASDFNNAMIRVGGVIHAIFQAMAIRIMPLLTKSMNAFSKWALHELPKMMPTIMKVTDAVINFGGNVIDIVRVIGAGIYSLINGLIYLNEKTNGWLGVLAKVAAFAVGVLLATFAPIFSTILGTIAAISIVWDDMTTSMAGGDSLVPWKQMYDWVLKVWDLIKSFFSSVQEYWQQFKDLFDFSLPSRYIGGVATPTTPGYNAGDKSALREALNPGMAQTNNNETTINITTADNPQAIASGVKSGLNDAAANQAARLQQGLTR